MNTRKKDVEEELLLDAIYESGNPAVNAFMQRAMSEEYARANERVLRRVAREFSHMLPPNQQRIVRQMAVAI